MAAFASLARATLPAVIGATWRAGWVLYAALGLVAALLLGGNGVPPSDIARGLAGSPVLRAATLAAWVLLTLPVARASLVVPSTFWLRSLPLPRGGLALLHAAVLLVAVEAPVAALLVAGGDSLGGATAALWPAAAHALVVARSPVAIALAALAACPAWLQAVGAALLLPLGCHIAVRRAPELGRVRRRALVFGGASFALASTHVATLWRRERGTLARGLLLALAGGGVAALAIRNNHLVSATTAGKVLLGLGGVTLPAGALGVATAAWRSERRDRWLLDATSTPSTTRVGAAAGVAVTWGALLGSVQGALVVALVVPCGPIVIFLQALWGAVLAALMTALVRSLVRDARTDGERALAATLLVGVVATFAAAILGVAALAAATVLAFAALAAHATAPSAPPARPPAPAQELP